MKDINKPEVRYYDWEEFNINGDLVGSGTRRYVRVHSSIIDLDELDDFLTRHWKYDSSYNFFMSVDTFKLYCKQHDIIIDRSIPDHFQCHGLEMFIIPPYIKLGEIIAVPQHDYEHQELSIIG